MLTDMPVTTLISHALASLLPALQIGIVVTMAGLGFNRLQQNLALAPCRVKIQQTPPKTRRNPSLQLKSSLSLISCLASQYQQSAHSVSMS
jgi:hypothetical protein